MGLLESLYFSIYYATGHYVWRPRSSSSDISKNRQTCPTWPTDFGKPERGKWNCALWHYFQTWCPFFAEGHRVTQWSIIPDTSQTWSEKVPLGSHFDTTFFSAWTIKSFLDICLMQFPSFSFVIPKINQVWFWNGIECNSSRLFLQQMQVWKNLILPNDNITFIDLTCSSNIGWQVPRSPLWSHYLSLPSLPNVSSSFFAYNSGAALGNDKTYHKTIVGK